jgi:hypothetical protein
MHPPELVYKIIELACCGYCGSLVSLWGRPPSAVRRAKPGSIPLECGVRGYCVCVRAPFEQARWNRFNTNPVPERGGTAIQHKPSREAAVRESPAREVPREAEK